MTTGSFSKGHLVALSALPAGGGLQAAGQRGHKHQRGGTHSQGLGLAV